MKKLMLAAILIASFSCKKQEEVKPGLLVKEVCCSPIYYGEILHKELYKKGDTLRIQYNQMPRHELAYPNKRRHEYTTVVIINL
jgi:hypothetical protein